MESTIIVALITSIGIIINTIVSKKADKKVDTINDIKQDMSKMREESKKNMKDHLLDSDKTYLINFLSELENGEKKSQIQIKRAYEIYERYTKNGGNSYVHSKWEELNRKELL